MPRVLHGHVGYELMWEWSRAMLTIVKTQIANARVFDLFAAEEAERMEAVV